MTAATGRAIGARRVGPVLLAVVAACGGNTPAAPTPRPSVQSVAVQGDSLMVAGASQALTVLVTLSGGSTDQPAGTAWSSTDDSIARPSPSAGSTTRVFAGTPGLASVFADYQGRRGEVVIRVIPRYEGTWQGLYTVTACSGTGSAEDIACRHTFKPGAPLPIALVLTRDATSVSGRLTLGPTSGDVGGGVLDDGRLYLSGRLTGVGMVVTITDWDTVVSGSNMQGDFSVALTLTSAGAWRP